jgi:DNA-binding beta-propeller fold protein YncE
VAVVDGDPASPTFLRIVASVSIFGNSNGIAVNAATNKIYLASGFTNQGTAGLSVIDMASPTPTQTQITGAPACYNVVVEPSQNMVYGLGTSTPNGTIVAVDVATKRHGIPVANFLPTSWIGS